MIIRYERSPIDHKVFEKFGKSFEDGIAVAYGDTVYTKKDLRPDTRVHEQTHLNQQERVGVKVWWSKYFVDKEFRLGQELEAFRAQIAFARTVLKDPNRMFLFLNEMRKSLARDYDCCTIEEAKELLT